MSRKVADLSVVTGTYQKDGQEKKKYQKVGIMMKDDQNGSVFLLINRFFNFAGVPGSEGRESVIVNVYQDDKQGGGRPSGGQQGPPSGGYSQGPPQQGGQSGYGGQGVPGNSTPQQGPPANFDDDIPF